MGKRSWRARKTVKPLAAAGPSVPLYVVTWIADIGLADAHQHYLEFHRSTVFKA